MVIIRYYSSLPRSLILSVYQAYKPDFELFDYSINDVLLKAGYNPISKDIMLR